MKQLKSKKTVLAALASMAALSAPLAMAQTAPGTPGGGQTPSVLPYPDFHFTGKIGETFQDSASEGSGLSNFPAGKSSSRS